MQLRWKVAWKVHAVLCTCFATIQCGKALEGQAALAESIFAAGLFGVLAVIPVMLVTLITEMRARQRFAAQHGMTAADIGCFWSHLFKLSSMVMTDASQQQTCLTRGTTE